MPSEAGRSYAQGVSYRLRLPASVRLSTVSKVGIIVSSLAALIGFVIAPLEPTVHMVLAGLGGLLVFPLSIYIVFVGSLKGGGPRRGLQAVPPVTAVTLSILSIPVALAGSWAWRLIAIASLTALALHVYLQLWAWRRREPRLPLLYPPLAGIVALAPEAPFIQQMLALALHYAAGMIMVVSPMTFARNYRVDPSRPYTYIPLAMNALSLGVLIVSGPGWAYGLLALTSVLAYFYFISVWRALPLAMSGARKGDIRGWALAYGAASHLASLAVLLLTFTVYLAGRLDLLGLLHMVVMGFVGVHVYMYIPLMLPSILRIKLASTMIPIPPLGMAAASLLRPWAPLPSYMLLLLSTLALIALFLPLTKIKLGMR